MHPVSSPAQSSGPAPGTASARDQKLMEAAQELEANFLAEMLKATGLGKPSEEFGGGVGEEQFGSFLRLAQAQEMVKTGGIGLAESLFNALKERADGSV